MTTWHPCQGGIIAELTKSSEATMVARKPSPSEMQDRIIVRLPDGMRDRLAELAKSNKRSVNAEVVSCLETLLQRSHVTGKPTVAGDALVTVATLQEQMSKLSFELEQFIGFVEATAAQKPSELFAQLHEKRRQFMKSQKHKDGQGSAGRKQSR
jgi:hypothetical protein